MWRLRISPIPDHVAAMAQPAHVKRMGIVLVRGFNPRCPSALFACQRTGQLTATNRPQNRLIGSRFESRDDRITPVCRAVARGLTCSIRCPSHPVSGERSGGVGMILEPCVRLVARLAPTHDAAQAVAPPRVEVGSRFRLAAGRTSMMISHRANSSVSFPRPVDAGAGGFACLDYSTPLEGGRPHGR